MQLNVPSCGSLKADLELSRHDADLRDVGITPDESQTASARSQQLDREPIGLRFMEAMTIARRGRYRAQIGKRTGQPIVAAAVVGVEIVPELVAKREVSAAPW